MNDDVQPKHHDLLSDLNLIEKVLQRAVQQALLRHKQAGNPICAWRNRKIIWIPPDEIPVGEK